MSNEGCSWMTGSVLKEEATLEMAVQGLSSLVHLLEARPTSHRSKRHLSSQFLRIRSSSRRRRSCELSFKAPSKGGCDAWRAAEHAAQHCSQGVGLVLTQSQGGLRCREDLGVKGQMEGARGPEIQVRRREITGPQVDSRLC